MRFVKFDPTAMKPLPHDGMTCMECLRPAGYLEPGLPVWLIVELCNHWLCDECLDRMDVSTAALGTVQRGSGGA